jgi:hypothetical protein
MKVHRVSNSEIAVAGGRLVPEYRLCIYEADTTDAWRGWIAADAGWQGAGELPGVPLESHELALQNWVTVMNQLQDQLQDQL